MRPNDCALAAARDVSDHDPENWKPVFRKDHAPAISRIIIAGALLGALAAARDCGRAERTNLLTVNSDHSNKLIAPEHHRGRDQAAHASNFHCCHTRASVFPQEITRALLNLISNGFYAAT